MKPSTLLPCIEGIRIESIASNASSIVLHLSAVAPSAYCPLCGHGSQRVHSHYSRTLADLPWNRVAVRIHLKARKFYCDQPECPRRIFTEPFPELAARYARKTNRLQEALYLIGYALGGEAGARVAVGLGLAVSPDTLLNRVRQAAIPRSAPSENVRVLGVDDWAFRKGQRYGTILVDLERHQLLDLLPERSVESLSTWLKAHPGVEIVSRDRALVYAEGATEGAPKAQQVADRFHLLQNLVETLQRLLLRYQRPLQEAGKQVGVSLQTAPTEETTAEDTRVTPRQTQKEQERQRRRERRKTRYEQVLEWHRQGASIHKIACNLKMHRRTVRQFLRATEFPERAPPRRRSSQHDAFCEYLRERWEAGCHNAAQLYRELKERGFHGSQSAVRAYLRSWRPALPDAIRTRRGGKSGAPLVQVDFSARTTAWLLLGYGKSKDTRQQAVNEAFLETLLSLCPAIRQAKELAVAFFDIVRQQNGDGLKAWIEQIDSSDLLELKSFARGLTADYDAVLAGINTTWSNGQVEGQVNRLKFVKRSMYGRAKYDLLKARVLPMAQAA